MLSELETVNELHKLFLTLVIKSVSLLKFFYYFDFHICIINIKFLVFTNFGCDHSLVWIFHIYTFDDLAKSSIIDNSHNLISVSKCLSLDSHILTLFVGNLKLVVPSNFADCVNSLVEAHFYLFKISKLWLEAFDCFLWGITVVLLNEILRTFLCGTRGQQSSADWPQIFQVVVAFPLLVLGRVEVLLLRTLRICAKLRWESSRLFCDWNILILWSSQIMCIWIRINVVGVISYGAIMLVTWLMLDNVTSKNALDFVTKEWHNIWKASSIVIILIVLMSIMLIKRILILVLNHVIIINGLLLLVFIHIARNICVLVTIDNVLSSIGTKTTWLDVVILLIQILVMFFAKFSFVKLTNACWHGLNRSNVRLYFLLWIPIALNFWGLTIIFIIAGQIDIASLRFRLVEYVFGLVLEHFRVRLQYLVKRLSLLGFSTLMSIFESAVEIWLLGRVCFHWDHERRWVIILKVVLVLICKRLVRISWSKAFV